MYKSSTFFSKKIKSTSEDEKQYPPTLLQGFRKMLDKKIGIIIFTIVFLVILGFNVNSSEEKRSTLWDVQSIDTMKYSRDPSREKLNDPSFYLVIGNQVESIAETGATHIGIATPYDEEFRPILKRWVLAARKNNLKVWFRGNWSGWEGWFEYDKITRDEHIKKTEEFILSNQDLFEDGDIFTPCPECENGGPGDPRHNNDLEGHRKFLIDEYQVTKSAFEKIDKDVASNYNSMNGDVARLVMDRKTTNSLDGIVAIDHYVDTPEKLIKDINEIGIKSGGNIVLGEIGVPIPDIHGKLSQEEQAEWISDALSELAQINNVVGINYWTNQGSSTALWANDGEEKLGVSVLKSFYTPNLVNLIIKDESGAKIKNANVQLGQKRYFSDTQGEYIIPYFKNTNKAKISVSGYQSKTITLPDSKELRVILIKDDEDFIFKLRKFLYNLTNFNNKKTPSWKEFECNRLLRTKCGSLLLTCLNRF